jgi:hypothetical protein
MSWIYDFALEAAFFLSVVFDCGLMKRMTSYCP